MSKEAERYTVTIHLAAPGTPRVDVGDAGQKRLLDPSFAGHMFRWRDQMTRYP